MTTTSLSLVSAVPPAPSTTRGQSLLLSTDSQNRLFAYGNGNAVYVRDATNVNSVVVCSRHTAPVTCARISPSGFLCASGDRDGNLLVWAVKSDTPVTLQQRPLSGPIRDIAWSEDQERLVAVGEGKGTMAVAIAVPAGNSIGNITAHERGITCCDFRKVRPFRICTGGADATVQFYEGPPFKFSHSIKDTHSSVVTCTRFSPNGELIASVSGAKAILICDGKTGEKLRCLTTEHTGTIYGLCWFPDGNSIATASADKTIRVCSAVDGTLKAQCSFSNAVGSMQVGLAFTVNGLLSVSLNGDLSFLDLDAQQVIASVWRGHQKTIVFAVPCQLGMLSCSSDGRALFFPSGASSSAVNIDGPLSDAVMGGSAADDAHQVFLAGADAVYRVDCQTQTSSVVAKLAAFPSGIAALDVNTVAVLYKQSFTVFVNGAPVTEVKLAHLPAVSIAAHGSSKLIAIGGEKAVAVFHFDGSAAHQVAVFADQHRGSVTSVAFSPSGRTVASGDSTRLIFVWSAATGDVLYDNLTFHNSRINALAFGLSENVLVSGSVDSSIIVWDLESKTRRIKTDAHHGGVTSLAVSGNGILSGGVDGWLRLWNL